MQIIEWFINYVRGFGLTMIWIAGQGPNHDILDCWSWAESRDLGLPLRVKAQIF